MKTALILLCFYNINFFKPEVSYLSQVKINPKELKERHLIKLARAKGLMITNIDSTIGIALESCEIAEKYDLDSLKAYSLYLLGEAYLQKGDFEKSEKYYLGISKIYEKNKKEQYLYLSSLAGLGNLYSSVAQFQKALKAYKKILEMANQFDLKEWRAFAFDGIGSAYYYLGNYEDALAYREQSLNLYNIVGDDENIIRLLYTIGASYTTISNYDRAIEFLHQSIDMAEQNNNLIYKILSIHAIGIIYERLKNYDMAIEFNKSALNILNNTKPEYLVASILGNIGEIYYQKTEYDSALFYYEQGIKKYSEINDNIGIAYLKDDIGLIFYKKHQYKKALEYFRMANKLIENIDEKYRKTKIQIHFGIVYTHLKKYRLAEKNLLAGLREAHAIKSQDLVEEAYIALAQYYEVKTDYKNAYRYLNFYNHLKDSIVTMSSHKIAQMQMRYETGKREKEKKILQNEVEYHKLELKKSDLEQLYLITSLSLVSIIGLITYGRYREKKKANLILESRIDDALENQKVQQEIIFHQAGLSSLGELAAGMAHEINQPLQDIRLCAESVKMDVNRYCKDNEQINENLREIFLDVDRIRSLISHVRVFSSQQKNTVDESFRIRDVLKDALNLVNKQYVKKGIEIEVNANSCNGYIQGNPYKFEQIVLNLLANARDALTEKRQQSKTTKRIAIDYFEEGNDTVFKVKDNGIGISDEDKEYIFRPFYSSKKLGKGNGLGLSIVFGIVKEFNGSIEVKSEHLKGTEFEVRIPANFNKTAEYNEKRSV